MKPEQIYEELKDLAEKLGITVSEQSFRTTGIKVTSGICKVKGQNLLIIDKHKSMHKKIRIMVSQLAKIPTENVFIVPAIRNLLEQHQSERNLPEAD